ncbi:MAG TPA: signal peptidase II [Microthrixaceae bacterium]|nr:signal peptidase II [Microthrixaceae bacterium]
MTEDSAASTSEDGPATDSVVSPSKAPLGSRRWAILAAAVAVVLIVDQLTKWWALDNLVLGYPRELFWTLRLTLAFNTGMAFSTGSGAGPIIGVIAIGIAIVMLIFARRVESRYQMVLIGMIIGGALGNVIDRLMRAGELGSSGTGFMNGGVVDFIDLQWWPVFNVADAAVVVGGIALALASFKEPAEVPSDDDIDGPPTDGLSTER